MAKFKEQLSEVTSELVTGLMDITQNVNLGFGMFVDKPTLPYTDLNRHVNRLLNKLAFDQERWAVAQ